MGKIYILLGKSASGKDTVYRRLLADESLKLMPYVGYTTRPIREGEKDGVEYHFTTVEQMDEYEAAGVLIEKRVYHTVYGDWYYYSVDSGEAAAGQDLLYIGTLESYKALRDYYGEETVVPIYIEVEDGLRLMRAIERERQQEKPGYAEVCRRFLADSEDFSEEKLQEAGITKRYDNSSLEICLENIAVSLNRGL